MPFGDIVEVVAERQLTCVRPSGERFSVTLRIGKPFPASEVDWACPVEASGLHHRLANIHGIDSFQALMLAQGLLRNLVQAEIETGSTFHSLDGNEPITVEQLFAKGI